MKPAIVRPLLYLGAKFTDCPSGLLGLALALISLAAFADDQSAPETEPAFKLTAGYYKFSTGANATDVNLRNTSTLGNLWFGYYESKARSESQWRTGWDRSVDLQGIRFSPSLQFASQGFAGFSAQVETGESWFVGAGIGRTNLRPYWNLNFDPNDSWTVSAGRRMNDGDVFGLLLVGDNRQNPDQRHLHGYYRTRLANGDRLTVDFLYKIGLVDDVRIRRWGTTITYDWPRFFVRVAYDPKVNFTADDMQRISIGMRF
jgi:hypothetical protein